MKTAKLQVTAEERPIVALLARGYCPKHIAASLGLTARGVWKTRRRVWARNGISNDVQLGMLIERDQFVPVYERNLIEDRREVAMDALRVAP